MIAAVVASEPIDLEQIRSFLEPRLAKYKLPRELVVREELPRTPSGKVMKHVLRDELFGAA